MVGSRATLNGLLLVTVLGVGCGGGTSFNGYGYTGGAAGAAGTSGSATGGTAGGNGGHSGSGTGTAGVSTGGYAAVAGIGVGGDVSYGGDVGIAGSYAGSGTAGVSTGGYAGLGTAGIGTAGIGTAGAGATAGAGTSGSAGTGGSDCTMLLAQATSALVAARECNPGVNALQCTGVISDLCGCSYSVNDTGSAASQAYLTLSKQILAQGCGYACTDIACPVVTNGTCQVSMTSSLGGVCVAIAGA
jgi:hypothetical protein